MKAIAKKRRERFIRAMVEKLKELGATPDPKYPDESDAFILETRFGSLWVRVDCLSTLYTLFTRFSDEDTPKAIEGGVPAARYSGKWNHHYAEAARTDYPERVAELIANELRAILVKPQDAVRMIVTKYAKHWTPDEAAEFRRLVEEAP